MKKLNDYILEKRLDEGLGNLIKNLKNKIIKKEETSTLKSNGKTAEMTDVAKEVEKKVLKNAHKDVDQFLTDLTEVVKKNIDKFKKILPTLQKWCETKNKDTFYNFDTLIGDHECTEFIKGVCSILANKYGYEGLEHETEQGEDEDGRWDEGGELLHDTAYVAFMLSNIAKGL